VGEHQTKPKPVALAHAIAEELNAIDDHTWMALNGYTHLAYIQATDGRRFSLRTTGYRFQIGDRLEISGSYPRNGDDEDAECTGGVSRSDRGVAERCTVSTCGPTGNGSASLRWGRRLLGHSDG
jgi:hypothetical protein